MKLLDVQWTPTLNVLFIRCDCGTLLSHWANFSVVQCPHCQRQELWHSVKPKADTGPWSLPVIKRDI